MRTSNTLAGFAALSLLGGATAAVAEPQAEGLDEIVVTARKTEERLIDVPLAITALSERAIEERGIKNLDDVAANTPGLTFSNVIGEMLPAPVIRGVAPIDILGENNTAIFIDGVYVSAREGLNFSQLDLERIEVVKGPQAAMYGRNSFSGAINYVTAKPTDVFKGKTEVTFGNDGRLLGSVSASGPLIEGVLKGRAAVLYDNFDGSYKNQWRGRGPAPDIGGYQYKTFQGGLVWTPNDNFEAEIGLYISDDQIDNSAMTAATANCENRSQVPVTPMLTSRLLNYCGELQSIGKNDLTVISGATGEDRDVTRGHLKLNWSFADGGKIDALTGYSATSQSFFVDGGRNDGENIIFTYLTGPTFPFPLGGGQFGTGSSDRKQVRTGLLQVGPGITYKEFSQELRYSSDQSKRFTWAVGGYYYDTTSESGIDDVTTTQPLPADFGSFCLACVSFGPGLWVDFAAGAGDAAFKDWFTSPTGAAISGNVIENGTKAPSGFVQAEFDITDRLSIGAEGRYTEEKKTLIDHQTNTRRSVKSDLVNWRTTLRFKPADNMSVYGAVAHAEKGGGSDGSQVRFVDNPGTIVTIIQPFEPEEMLSYELGMKSEFLDRRLGVELDAYYMDWTQIVIPQVFEAIGGRQITQPVSLSANGGDATIQGAELSITARPVHGLDLNAGVSYIDGQYDHAKVATFAQFPSFFPDGDISGKQILRLSEWQWNAGAGYSAPLRGDTNWFFRTDASYRGKQFADSSNQAILPSSLNVNASLGVRTDTWSLELWGRNLTDEDAPSGAFRDVHFTNTLPNGTSNSGAFFPIRYTVSHPRLMTYGITWRMRF
ncbi:MAG: TonB-dependent receptor [Steroidobacteraceae bacterium]